MSMMTYRRRYVRQQRGEDPRHWVNDRDTERLRGMRARDREGFVYFMPELLINIFSDSYGDKPRMENKAAADFVYRESEVSPDIQCDRKSYEGEILTSGPMVWHAAQRLNEPQIKYCVSVGANIKCGSGRDGSLPLHQAVVNGADIILPTGNDSYKSGRAEELWIQFLDVLKVLLASGCDINDTDLRGWTCVMHLCSGVVLLKDSSSEHGSSHEPRKDEDTDFIPLVTRRLDALREFLRRGARVDVVGSSGETAVSLAAKADQYAALKILCEEQSEAVRRVVNVRDLDGNCAIHHAAKERNTGVLSKLLEFGADGYAVNGFGQTAAEIIILSVKPACSRFERSHDQRLIGVLPKHGFTYKNQIIMLREAFRCNNHPLIAAVLDGGFVFDVNSILHQMLFLECAAMLRDDMFNLLRMLAQWPDDVMCDAFLLRVAVAKSTTGSYDYAKTDDEAILGYWEEANHYGLATHTFPERGSSLENIPEEMVFERLTIFGQTCQELKTWDELRRPLGFEKDGDPRLVINDQAKLVHKLHFHRIKLYHRLFGMRNSLFLHQYHMAAANIVNSRERDEIRRFAAKKDYQPLSELSAAKRQERIYYERETVRMLHLEMEIGLEVPFTDNDTLLYLRNAADEIITQIEHQEFDRGNYDMDESLAEADFGLLARWCVHILDCTSSTYFMHSRVLERLRNMLMVLTNYSHIDAAHLHLYEALPYSITQFSPSLREEQQARQHNFLALTSVSRSYNPAVHARLRELCRQLGCAWKQQKRHHYPSVMHYAMIIEKERRYNTCETEREELRRRLPLMEAFVHGSFDLHTRDERGVTVIGQLLDLHARLVESDAPDDDDAFKMWDEIIVMLQSSGLGVHWDAPYSYKMTLQRRAMLQFPSLKCISQPDRSSPPDVPRLLCLAAKAITELPVHVRSFLPKRMLHVVDIHRPPALPAGKDMWKPVDTAYKGDGRSDLEDWEREAPVNVMPWY